jgi:hypothetical protein
MYIQIPAGGQARRSTVRRSPRGADETGPWVGRGETVGTAAIRLGRRPPAGWVNADRQVGQFLTGNDTIWRMIGEGFVPPELSVVFRSRPRPSYSYSAGTPSTIRHLDDEVPGVVGVHRRHRVRPGGGKPRDRQSLRCSVALEERRPQITPLSTRIQHPMPIPHTALATIRGISIITSLSLIPFA